MDLLERHRFWIVNLFLDGTNIIRKKKNEKIIN